MDNGEQIFKITTYQWFIRFLAYSKGELEKAPSRYLEFQKYMKAANSAIRAANIEGVDTISENPADIDIINLNTRRTKLKNFAFNIKREADELIDDPFVLSMTELAGAIEEHSRFQVDYNGEVQTIEYGEQGSEYIDKLFQALIDSNDYDSKELTGNENVDKYIKEYSKYDPVSKKYGYEKVTGNLENLNPDQQEALRHMYEYNFRVMENDIYGNTYEGKKAQDTLNRMNDCFYEVDEMGLVTVKKSARVLLQLNLAHNGKIHCYKLLNSLVSGTGEFDAGFYQIDANGEVKDGWYAYDIYGKESKTSLKYEYDKAGIRLVFRREIDDKELEYANREIEIGYYTTRSRCERYVASEIEKNPGCYDHAKELGFGKRALVSMLLSAENSTDMHVLENITKGNGDYSKIFDRDVEKMSESGKELVSDYIVMLQSAYASTKDSKYANELNSLNDFYFGDNEYASGYFHLYVDKLKPHMSEDELVDVWLLPNYKLSDEEIKEAEEKVKVVLEKYETTNGDPVILAPEEKAILYKYQSLENKIKTGRCAWTSFWGKIFQIGDFALDAAEDLAGSAAEMVANSIDPVFGTNTTEAVLDIRDKYSAWSEGWVSEMKTPMANASVQHPIAAAGGSLGANIFLYWATSPIFDGLAASMGIESAGGKFIVNQIGQNAQDLVLDTRVEYEELIADGDFSAEDRKKIRNNVIGNLVFNGIMGAPELLHDLKIEKAVKETEKAIGNSVDITHHTYKGMDSSAAKNIELEKIGDVNGTLAKNIDVTKAGKADDISKVAKRTEKASTQTPRVPDGSAAKSADAAKVAKSVDATKAGNVDEVTKITKQTGKTAPNEAKVPDGSSVKSADAVKAGNVDGVSKIIKQTEAPKVPDDAAIKSDIATSAPGDASIMKNTTADMNPEANIAKIEAEALQQTEAEHLAEQILKKAKAAEAETTATMKALEANGGHLEGLEHRLKSKESLTRKILSDSHNDHVSLGEAASDINDSLRYTMVFDEVEYTKNVDDSLNQLRKQGYIVEELKNYWGDSVYQGINVTLTSPEGVKLELQFHTDASFYTKEHLNHSYYETARSEFTSKAEKEAAIAIMEKNQANVNAPLGVMSIGRQMEITPEAKLAKTEAVQQASKIGKKIEGDNVAANVAIEANKEATEAIEKVGKKLGYSDNVVKSYSKKIEDIEFEYYERELKKATKKTSVSEQEVIDFRRTQISDADYYKMVAQKKLNGMDAILQYKNRFDAGAFEKGYSLDEILEYKINKNAPVKDYSGITNGDFLPTVDAFIADDQIISHMKEALPNNASIQGCTTLQELADVLHNEKPKIELVVFQSKEPGAGSIETYAGSFGPGFLGFREGGVYSVPKYKLKEYAENYSNLCGFNNGKFEIYDYEKFGADILCGVDLKSDYGAYMIETLVPINGNNIGMPSVNNCCAYMDEFVSGGYLRVKPEIELTQKQLDVDLKKGFGKDKGVEYKIHVLYGNTKATQNGVANANASNVSNHVSTPNAKSSTAVTTQLSNNASTMNVSNSASITNLNKGATATQNVALKINKVTAPNASKNITNSKAIYNSAASASTGVNNINGTSNIVHVYNRSDAVKRIITSDDIAWEYKQVVENNIYNNPNLSPEEMVKEEMALFNSLPPGKRTDINPVNNYKAVRTDAESLKQGVKKGSLPISWHNHHGLDENKPIMGMFNQDGSCNLPDTVCRRGSAYGNNLSSMKADGTMPSLNEVAVPYAENIEAQHIYNVDQDVYKDVIDLIAGADKWNATDLDNRVNAINDIIDRMNYKHKTKNKHIDVDNLLDYKEKYICFQKTADSKMCRSGTWSTDTTYGVCGTVAPMHVDDKVYKEKIYDGGAPQFNTPMPIYIFERTGAMWETK